MRLNRQTLQHFGISDTFKPTWRQRLAVLLGRAIHVRFDSCDSRLNVSCHLSWRTEGDAQWHVANPLD